MKRHQLLAGLLAALAGGTFATAAMAQSASLYGPAANRAPLTLERSSWFYVPVEPPRELRLHDIITVVVDEKTQVLSEGEVDRKRTSSLKATLAEWIKFDDGDLKPAEQADGDPKINASLDSRLKTEGSLETRDGMRFRIAATIVDIRPNGTLVLEAHRTLRNNHEIWEQSLTGIIRREDVLPNNTVMSEDIAGLEIHKREIGHVRDSYKRGWFTRWLDQVQPF